MRYAPPTGAYLFGAEPNPGEGVYMVLSTSKRMKSFHIKARWAFLLFALPGLAGARNLAAYEALGPLDAALDPRPTIQLVNSFVLKHWQNKVPGHVTFTLYSKEGLPTTTELFIESDHGGKWSVAVLKRGSDVDSRTHRAILAEPVYYTAYDIASSTATDGSLYLSLKGRHGRVLSDW